MSYECRHFAIEELVPPETVDYFEARGGKQRAWQIFDGEALLCLDLLRDDLGPCSVNTWKWGGARRYSGFRPADCSIGADYSLHRLGKGFDLNFQDVDADEARAHIVKHRERFHWVRGLETGIPWVHIDGRNVDGLLQFAP